MKKLILLLFVVILLTGCNAFKKKDPTTPENNEETEPTTGEITENKTEEHVHSWKITDLSNATWITDGQNKLICECGQIKIEKVEKLGHDWSEFIVTTEATCNEEGVKTSTCNNCKGTKTEKIDKLSHNFNETWSYDEENHWYECACKEKESNENHSFNQGEVVTEATEISEGLMKYTCETCGYVKDVIIPMLNSIDLSKLVFESLKVNFDGNTHSIYALNIPENVTVEYVGNGVSEEGSHTVIAKFYYNEKLIKEITATITIVKNPNVELPLV